MALELRVMGGSDVTMAPQHGNKHGTLSIEPVSTRMVHKEVWEDFKEELAKVVSTFTSLLSLSSPTIWAVHAPLIKHREEIFTLPYNFYGNLDFLWICCINRAGAPSGAVVV